jgi:ADP-heptose:LPS heptosyltransferase
MAGYSHKCYNMAGKTSLPEYVNIVAGSALTISVDTGPMHIAAASGCPVIGLFSGKFYKRYSPYPAEINPRFYPVYPDFTDGLIAARNPVIYDHWTMKNDTIKQIPAEKVISLLQQIWNTIGQ